MTKITVTLFNFFKNLRHHWISIGITIGIGGIVLYISQIIINNVIEISGMRPI